MAENPFLLQRINAALAEGKRTGKITSARHWAKLAGLSDNYVGVLKTRLSSGEVKQAKGEELGRLAAVLGLSVEYFLDSDKTERTRIVVAEGGRPDLEEVIRQSSSILAVLPAEKAVEVLTHLRNEFFHGAAALPPQYWPDRLQRLVNEAQDRAKDAPRRPPIQDVDLTEESPEVRAGRKKPKRM